MKRMSSVPPPGHRDPLTWYSKEQRCSASSLGVRRSSRLLAWLRGWGSASTSRLGKMSSRRLTSEALLESRGLGGSGSLAFSGLPKSSPSALSDSFRARYG